MIAFNGYANEEGTEVAVVQVHPDTESMQHHMQVVRQHITDAYASLLDETTSIQVFGHLSEAAREMMQQEMAKMTGGLNLPGLDKMLGG